jgi:hypothetical protein
MRRQDRCKGTTQEGNPCGSFAVRDGLCVSHHPELKARKAEGSRRGGEAKANARRAAKAWAAAGDVISPDDLPAMLRGAFVEVWQGKLEPGQAQALVSIAKASVSLAHDLELEARISALEEATGLAQTPPNVRRLTS